jgi:DNA 3'-phosphatase
MVFSPGSYDPARPVAAFDFDSTLRHYKGSGPPEELTRRFLALIAPSFNLVIVSNRSHSTAAALAPLREYVALLDAATRAGGDRVSVYAPTAHDRDRKPHTGAWEHYVATLCRGAPPRFAFFCGDAAGRPGDFSAADYLFARNTGLTFIVPELLFAGGREPWVNPLAIGCSPGPVVPLGEPVPLVDADVDAELEALLEGDDPLCILLVGSPASGKSRVAARLVARDFVLASGDVDGARHRRVFTEALKAGRRVVVDNTNPLCATRKSYADEATAAGYATSLCYVATPKAVCFHLDAARCQLDIGGGTKELPAVALHTYWKRLEPPTEKEATEYGGRLVVVPFALAADAPPEVTRYRYANAKGR